MLLTHFYAFNPLYTGGLFQLYIGQFVKKFVFFRDVRPILSLLFYFLWKIVLTNNIDPDQTLLNVASDLGLHCLPLTLLQVFR